VPGLTEIFPKFFGEIFCDRLVVGTDAWWWGLMTRCHHSGRLLRMRDDSAIDEDLARATEILAREPLLKVLRLLERVADGLVALADDYNKQLSEVERRLGTLERKRSRPR
jgi:hypothetical protein